MAVQPKRRIKTISDRKNIIYFKGVFYFQLNVKGSVMTCQLQRMFSDMTRNIRCNCHYQLHGAEKKTPYSLSRIKKPKMFLTAKPNFWFVFLFTENDTRVQKKFFENNRIHFFGLGTLTKRLVKSS